MSIDQSASAGDIRHALDLAVEAASHLQRLDSIHAALRIDLMYASVREALRSSEQLTTGAAPDGDRRELALRAVVAEYAVALRLSERTARRLISEAWTLSTALTATLAQLRDGRITPAHASVIVDETIDLSDRPEQRAELEASLLDLAETASPATLRRRARVLRQRLAIEPLSQRHERALDERRVELEPTADGMAWLHLLLAGHDAALIHDRVVRLAEQAVEAPASTPGGDRTGIRTPSQTRADVARDLLLHGVPAGDGPLRDAARAVRPTVHVTVPVLTLLGRSDEPGHLRGVGPIAPEVARHLAAQAPSFTRLLTHPVDGTVLDVDRTTYRVPADLKRWIEVRDETCRFPGCNRDARRCDADHVSAWAHGGRTAGENLAHLCRHHHRLKHETTWRVEPAEGALLEWVSPTGRRYITAPAGGVRSVARSAEGGPRSRGSRCSPVAASPPF